MNVLVLTQPNCRFCDRAKTVVRQLAADYELRVTEQSMLEPAGRLLAEQHGVLFAPGIVVDGELVTYGRPSERRLRREIDRRSARPPSISSVEHTKKQPND